MLKMKSSLALARGLAAVVVAPAVQARTTPAPAAAKFVSERFLLSQDAARLIADARQRDLGF